jgi:hypothetical protein
VEIVVLPSALLQITIKSLVLVGNPTKQSAVDAGKNQQGKKENMV